MSLGNRLLVWAGRAVGPLVGVLLGAMLVTVVGAHNGPPTTGTIHSCVGRIAGVLRIIEPNEACRPNEMPLDWVSGGGSAGGVSQVQFVSQEFAFPFVPCCSQPPARQTLEVSCPGGKNAIGGGYKVVRTDNGIGAPYSVYNEMGSGPSGGPNPTGWALVNFQTPFEAALTVTVYATCATLST